MWIKYVVTAVIQIQNEGLHPSNANKPKESSTNRKGEQNVTQGEASCGQGRWLLG